MPDLTLYPRLFLTFARNSLIRDMTFRTNFLIEVVSSIGWMAMNLGFYLLVFQYTNTIGDPNHPETGWNQWQFFVFIATTMFINSLVQALFMPNAQEMSELVRTGGLDFALLKPIDAQFLLSLRRINWSSLGNFVVAFAVLIYASGHIEHDAFQPIQYFLYPCYIVCGVLILYSVMISLAATSIWLGRNQTLYDFWFYITNFSRYPLEIYGGNALGNALRTVFTYIVPVLVVVNVPARMMAKPLTAEYAWLAGFALLATVVSLVVSRWIFQRALASYRSASS
ncbi:ABC transporter permease [Aeoliella sp.]|uniref:ABC transporter permease n=1 Tax=Aeoliella sp. TaxID=2795800 RepID=UPI003CCBFBB0